MENPVSRQEFECMMQMIRSTQDMLERLTSTIDMHSRDVWDDYDVMKYLRISESSLKRGRKDKENPIPFFRVLSCYRYDRLKIIAIKDRFLK